MSSWAKAGNMEGAEVAMCCFLLSAEKVLSVCYHGRCPAPPKLSMSPRICNERETWKAYEKSNMAVER